MTQFNQMTELWIFVSCMPKSRNNKLMYTKTKILLVRASTILSSRQTSIQRGESDSDLIAYFSLDNIWKVILKKEVRNEFYKNIQRADLDSPRRKLFIRGLRFVVALSVPWGIILLCAYF